MLNEFFALIEYTTGTWDFCFSLWPRPPTGHAMLCKDKHLFQGGALCPTRRFRESMR